MFRTNCIEIRLRNFFLWYSKILSRYPVIIALMSSLIAICFSTGLVFLSYTSNTEELFTPLMSQARYDRDLARDLFLTDYDRFLPNRVIETDQRQISVLFTAIGDENLLHADHLKEISDFNADVISFKILASQTEYSFDDLCARWNSECIRNPLLEYLNKTVSDKEIKEVQLPFPNIIDEYGNEVNIEPFLGGVHVEGYQAIFAKSLLVVYYLRGTFQDPLSKLWEEEVVRHFDDYNLSTELAMFPSDGLDQAQADVTTSVIPSFTVTYSVLITFAITSCVMFRDHVQSKPWLASVGVLSATLAIASALGLLSYFKVPFNQVATSVPFLILGIGLDDMFILISSWRKSSLKKSVEERMSETLADAGVSITITTITDFLAFLVGSISPLPAIKIFCLYAGVAVLFDLFFQVTFFGSFLVFFGRRESANRHSMSCLKVRPQSDHNNSKTYNIFCSGGLSKETNSELEGQTIHLATIFFRHHFSKLFSNVGTIVIIIILYMLYLGSTVFGCTNVGEGLLLQNLAIEGSHEYNFLARYSRQFREIGPSVSLMITGQELPYWETDVREHLLQTVNTFQENYFIKSTNYTQCWFSDYYNFLDQNKNFTLGKNDFIHILQNQFLPLSQNAHYNLDINFDGNTISSSRCILVTQNVETAKRKGEMMLALRDLASLNSDDQGAKFTVYAPDFVFYEQYVIVISQTIQSLGIAAASMFLVSLLLIPNPLVALLVALSVTSIITGVIGFMTFWGVRLDSISLVNLVLCIGFCVDFTAHIAYAFVTSDDKLRPVERLSSCLSTLGYPILQSAISTILGVVVLLLVPSYIFQTFAKIMILVMFIGLLHGLLFVPVAMVICTKVPIVPITSNTEVSVGSQSGVTNHAHVV